MNAPLDLAGLKARGRFQMRCKSCEKEPVGACKKCGGFYCADHGAETLWGPFCVSCYDKRRPWGIVAGVFDILLGIASFVFGLFLAWYSPFIREDEAETVVIAVFSLVAVIGFSAAGFCFWLAARRFP